LPLIVVASIIVYWFVSKKDLSKYSYLIRAEVNGEKVAGTCFFIKKGGVVYFVTAKHLVSGCVGTVKKYNYAKEIEVDISGADKPLKINCVPINDTIKCNALDLYVAPIDKYYSNYVNTVEMFVDEVHKFGDITMWGYQPTDNNWGSPKKRQILEDNYNSSPVTNANTMQPLPFTTSANFTNNFTMQSMMGYSGCPVFVQDIDGIKLLGVHSMNHPPNSLYITSCQYVETEAILNEIKNYEKNTNYSGTK